MKKEYINPNFEIIVVKSENILEESSYDPDGIFDKNVDHNWY